ncbi:DUF6483 family protein [uncultured Clostridium sp.]|uniref:DUF6483 family protein n=1 Tax=uncultured Clostridium sp. TaxID=59620 RepID=UPI0032164010
MYENDYMMKMIKTALQAVASIFKGKNAIENSIDENSDDITIAEDQLLEIMIRKYIIEGEINKAENMLFEAIDSHKSPKNLELALFFYEEISKWTEDKLISCNFSKEEILEGLNALKRLYNE